MSLFYVQWDTDLYRLWAATPEHAAIALGQYLPLPDSRHVTVYPGVEIVGRIDPKPMLEQGCVYQLDIDDGVVTARLYQRDVADLAHNVREFHS